jgi:hypothetical protein
VLSSVEAFRPRPSVPTAAHRAGPPGPDTRENEWYAIRRGPAKLRALVNLTFFPYTLMNVSYAVIGSLVPAAVHWDRTGAAAFIYLFSVGVSAHALDARAPNKPWGRVLSERSLLLLALGALVPVLAVGIFYAVAVAPLLWPFGAVELFFLFSYNMELFGGRFHSDTWFALSWGALPVLSGCVLQSNGLSPESLLAAAFGFATALVEIRASRPYKAIMKKGEPKGREAAAYERRLKGVVGVVIAVALAFVALRLVS